MVLAALPAARDDVRTLENTGSPTLISIVIPLFNEVGNVPLLDLGLERLAATGFSGKADVAVNAHHHPEMIVEHVASLWREVA